MRKLFVVLLIMALIAGLSGCASAPAAGASSPQATSSSAARAATARELAKWAGAWNNFYGYFEDPDVQKAYVTLAVREGTTPEAVKARYVDGATYQCDIAALRIDGDEITFYSVPQTSPDAKSGILSTLTYRYSGEVTDVNDVRPRAWAHFETDADTPYKHLILLPPEADIPGETAYHFHFRYARTLEEAANAEMWFATMVSVDTTPDLIVGHMTAD